jgi:N-acyl-D-amino-acid deacylase
VRERGDLTVEGAVHERTGRQADVFALADRGRLVVGAVGDVAIFALEELVYADDERAVDLPGGDWRLRRPWGGYRYTIPLR